MDTQTAICVDHVTKIYRLYDRLSDRLKDSLGLTRKKCYREHYALQDLSFSVKKGETIGIIGANGAGKSTILKIITGVLGATSGSVTVDGRISALLELGAGFNMEYTGIENIYLNGTMMGFTDDEIDARMQDILEFADIGDFVYQPVKTFSSGMFVRLAFAVAINIDPEILIVDEALSVGDVFFQSKCYRKFDEFKAQGRTILFVSHDLSAITKYCERAILLDGGKKIFEGSPREAIDIYKKVITHQYEENPSDKNDGVSSHRWKDSVSVNPQLIEYGQKEAEIIDYAVTDDQGQITNTLIKGSEFSVRMKVEFHKDISEPIYAFTIKNLKGIEITGTNTMCEKIDVKPHKAGEQQEITFTQNLDLQGGEYLISLGCTGYINGELNVFHRLYDVCSLTVISDHDTVGFYDMHTKIAMGSGSAETGDETVR